MLLFGALECPVFYSNHGLLDLERTRVPGRLYARNALWLRNNAARRPPGHSFVLPIRVSSVFHLWLTKLFRHDFG